MQTTKVTILRIVSIGDGANAGTTDPGGQARRPSGIDTSKRKESRLQAIARSNRSSVRSRIDHSRREGSVRDFSVGKSRRFVRRSKLHLFRSIFCRKNGLSQR
jgi:hypothetical protein